MQVDIKISPVGRFLDMYDTDPVETYTLLAQELSSRNIAYIHTIEPNPNFDQNLDTPYFKKAEL